MEPFSFLSKFVTVGKFEHFHRMPPPLSKQPTDTPAQVMYQIQNKSQIILQKTYNHVVFTATTVSGNYWTYCR